MSSFKKFRVLLTHPNIPKIAIDLLRTKCEVTVIEEFSRDACLKHLLNCDGVMLYGHKLVIDKELLDMIGPRLKVISQMGVGVDHIDVPYVKEKKILLGNTKYTLDNCVAEVAIMLALSVAHRAKEGFNKIKKKEWVTNEPQWLLGQQITNSVIGIIGFGEIGKAIATRLLAFSPSKILYFGRTDKSYASEFNAKRVQLKPLLQESDFVFVSCALTNETFHLINMSSFKIMKQSCVLVNVARGDIIHQDDLITALKDGDIFGAGLDVMTPEPLPSDHPLTTLENCIITPHIGSATSFTRNKMAETAAQNILTALEGQPMISPL